MKLNLYSFLSWMIVLLSIIILPLKPSLAAEEKKVFRFAVAPESAPQKIKDMLKEYPPFKNTKIGEDIYYFTRILKTSYNRDHMIMYVNTKKGSPDGKARLVPRLLYRSDSEGAWRAVPKVHSNGYLDKGKGISYALETKLISELSAFISDNIEEDPKGVLHIDDSEKLMKLKGNFVSEDPFYTYKQEVSKADDIGKYFAEMTTLEQGGGFCEVPGSFSSSAATFTSLLETISSKLKKDFLEKIMPDFTKRPTKTYHFSHNLLSKRDPITGKFARDIEVREYNSPDGKWRWSMAFDRKGRVWVDNLIQLAGNDATSYGTYSKITDVGVLGNKPIEYVVQSYQLKAGESQPLSYCFDEAEKICITGDELYLKLKKVYTPLMIKKFGWRNLFFDIIKESSLRDYNEIIEKYPQYCLELLDSSLSRPLSNLEKSFPSAYNKLKTLYPEYFKSITRTSTYGELLSSIKNNPRLNQIYSQEEDNFLKSLSAKIDIDELLPIKNARNNLYTIISNEDKNRKLLKAAIPEMLNEKNPQLSKKEIDSLLATAEIDDIEKLCFYQDITPVLSHLTPIKAFKKAIQAEATTAKGIKAKEEKKVK
ncbi:MAG: hypothetical protein HQK51_11135 [Oligoflexia bacterium]|nr:hypothetical protein [Oligoflexia bacterium]